jgi:amino acid adenylation domain-containing protein
VHTIQKYGCSALQEDLLSNLASGREISAFALTEPYAGSNPRAIQTQAMPDGRGGWILNGEKYLVDSGSWASVITVFARTSDQKTGSSGISAFAVRQGRPGLVIGGESLTMGLRGMVQNTMSLRDVRVGAESLLGSPGAGIAISQDTLSLARLNLAAKSIGGMKRCLQLMHRYASRRPVATGLLWDNPVTRSRIVGLVSAVNVVEALLGRISRSLDMGEEVPTEAFLACKVAASEYLWKTANTLVQVLGGRGYVDTNVAPQILRDARSFLLSEGPTETLLMYLGSRVIHAGNELERFIAVRLDSPRVAGRLREVTERIRDRSLKRSESEGIGEPNASYWASSLVGKVAMWATLVAAADNSGLKGHEIAKAWVGSKFEERLRALTEGGSAEWALGHDKAAEDLIGSYAESIGEAEQSLPAAVTERDPLLRKAPSASEDRGSHSPKAVSRLSMLPPEERHLLVYGWNDTASSYPKDACIHQLFEQQVARSPERPVVECDGEVLSYGELNARADRLAQRLRQAGVRNGMPVGLCVERSPDLLVGLLGILKAGGAYVPFDVTYPRRRLAHMLEDARVPVMVAQPELAAKLPENAARVVRPDAWKEVETSRNDSAAEAPTAGQCAYVMYTSGSTGRPKGVEVCHRSVVNFLLSMRKRPGLSENDVLVAVTTISFDIAALELFLPLVTGARLVLASRRTALDGIELAQLIEKSGATVLQATPATWQMLLASGWQGSLGLKALCGGESLPPDLARSIQSRTASLWNLYGPGETTIWSCVEKVTDDSGPITIGRPIANTRVYLLDEELAPVPVGAPGEIFIGGEGVAQGYWKRPDLTAERFLPDPFRPGERVYRTGDVARFLSDGRIEHLGRSDHQVKIRGFRIELGEIETALASHGAVRQVVIVARRHGPGDTRLVAYVTLLSEAARQGLIPELQKHVREYVPAYMVPSAFVVLQRFPLTPNGKVDRAALPAPQPEDIISEAHGEACASPVEEEIKSIWSNVLQISNFGREDDFFAIGGHSLLATQVVSQIRKAFGVEIPIALIFERPTVAALTQAVDDALEASGPPVAGQSGKTVERPPSSFATEAQRATDDGHEPPSPALEPVERDGALELSFAQERLWFLDQLDPGSARYHVPVALRLDGRLQIEALRRAFEQIVARHEVLRARFELRDGRPSQTIEPAGSWPLPVVALESLSEEPREAERERIVQQEATRPFDLSRGPLLRTTLLRLEPDKHLLLVTTHHIVSDGWSMEVLLRELGILYTALSQGRSSPLLPLPIQYADYALWQRKWLQGRVLEKQVAYWRKQLAGLPVLDLPTDHPRPSMESDRGATHRFVLSAELSARLHRLAREQGATMFMTLMAAWQALLSRYSGQEDFGIGFPIANRMQEEVEALIGCFVNTLVLRADVSGNPTYAELLALVRERALKAYAHQGVSFEWLVHELGVKRDNSRSPLFQVMFVLQNAPAADPVLPGLRLTPLAVTTMTSKFDLTLSIREHEEMLLGEVEYNADLFDASTIERMSGHFQVLLRDIVDHPEVPIGRLSLLTEAEQHQLLIEWNSAGAPCPRNKSIHRLFEEQVDRTPERVAVSFEDRKLTYGQLNARANQLARYLGKLGVGPEVLVGICMERSLDMVVGLFGILKAGGAYVPLDPEYPKERLAFMLENARAPVLLSQQGLLENLPAHDARVVSLDGDGAAIRQESRENLESGAAATNLAYVIYTSGSTGRPKGVMIEHGNSVAFLSWAHTIFTAEDLAGVLASTSICFDLSVFEIFAPLSAGGGIILEKNALALPAPSAAPRVTLLNMVPSAIAELLRANRIPPSVRTINLAGEPLKAGLVKELYERTSATKVYDLYGPSEDTTYSTWALRTRQGPQTIGRPISNTRIYILDGDLNPVPRGIAGELHIAGDGLARGYLNQPALTTEKFIPNPFNDESGARLYRTGDRARYLSDGNIELLGRIDNQVKIRGFRVETEEIEAVLGHHPEIRECVVTAPRDASGERRLLAYVVPSREAAPAIHELRNFLRQKLPDYMVPAGFMFLDSLPLTPNGKLDRKALPAPDSSRPDLDNGFVAPRTPEEQSIAKTWVEVLSLETVGIHDNFFDLGGHSLLATQVVSRLRDTFHIDLPLRSLFESPTVAGLAERIETLLWAEKNPSPARGAESEETEEIEL